MKKVKIFGFFLLNVKNNFSKQPKHKLSTNLTLLIFNRYKIIKNKQHNT